MKSYNILILLSFVASQVFVPCTAEPTCCDSCCDPNCKDVQPINISLSSLVSSHPKLDVVIVPSNPIYAGIDNICWSFLYLTPTTYTLFTSEVYCNNMSSTSVYQVTQTAPGVLAFSDPLCSFKGTIFGQMIIKEEGCNVILIYLCFLSGECDLETSSKTPVVFGLSPLGSKLSKLCIYKTQDLIDRAGFGSQNYNILPRKQPRQCVTKYPY